MASSQTAGETELTASDGGETDPALDRAESGVLEVVSVTDEDLPVVETPTTFNVSSFSSRRSRSIQFYDPETRDPHVPVELPAETSAPLPGYKTYNIQIPPSPGVPIIKVQPFLAVGLRTCSGKFRCALRCISRTAVCDGVDDCGDGEDELNCVRVSGRSSVLQVYSRGLWRTVCFEGWDSNLGSSACRQLGYNSYVNSNSIPITSIEDIFQKNLVALNISHPALPETFKIHNSSYLSFAQPALWAVHAGISVHPMSGSGAVAVEKIIYHANYKRNGLGYDIALIKLKQLLTFNDQLAPICLPTHGETFETGQMCVISGWGATTYGGESSTSLQSAMVPLLSSRHCGRPGRTSWNICAGFLEGGAGGCQGDNGGPLACRGSVWTLVGTASLAQNCGQKNKPGVYTSITQSLTWIHQQMEFCIVGYYDLSKPEHVK
ncbi:Transmembrane protease serine 13 [Triplophysa tibetana]|uniref:Transmembrane protease serine 13 n=1 Tax=Triplophysa tibetana TaxID=1572043 RepID=A0A5A9PL83_9TELE|nr:Transmembrane protease serine 13 [Triplophysa tibetana]